MGAIARRRPMVGRASELDLLEAEYRRTRAGVLRCVLVEGDAGMGKTRLVSEFLSARRRGALTLAGRGYPFGSSTSFGLWAEALDAHLRSLPAEAVRALCGGSAQDLAGILRRVVVPAPDSAVTAAPRPLAGLAVLLENLSRIQPVIVHLDDLHLADASSWEALDYLAHNLGEAPILIVGCVRAGALAGRWAYQQTLFRLEQEGMLGRIDLQPLTGDDIRQLADEVLAGREIPDAFVEWLLERSVGTPLFVLGLIDALVEGRVDLSAPQLETMPASLTDRVLASLVGLDPAARRALESLAVLGHGATLPEVRSYTGASEAEAAAAVGTLVGARLVDGAEGSGGASYRIVHPLVQDAIYESIVLPRRRSLHRAVARSLVQSGRLGEAAPHLVRSADRGDAEAIEGLERAARQAWASRAFAEAFEIMSALFEVIPSGDPRGLGVLDLIDLEGEWFFHHKTDVDYALCIRVLRKAERLVESFGDQRRLATLNVHLASFLGWGTGDLGEAARRAQAAYDIFRREGDQRHALLALNELTQIIGIAEGFAAQEQAGEELVAAAEASGDHGALLLALANVASTAWPRGRFTQAASLYRRCAQIASDDPNLPRLRHAHTFLAMTLALEGRLEEARASFAAAVATDPESSDGLILEFGPHLAWLAGDLTETLTMARSSIARVGPRRLTVVPMIGALAAAEMGQTEPARSLLAGAADVLTQRRRWMIRPYYRWASGILAWRAGQTQRAIDELERSASALIELGADPLAALVLTDLVEAAAITDPAAADRAVEALADAARRLDRDLHRGLAALAIAQVGAARGSGAAVAAQAEEAVQLLGGRGYLLIEARALDVLSRCLATLDPPRAVDGAGRAAALFRDCGAAWRQDRALETLRALGKPGRRTAAGIGRDALSRREREVIDLAVEGLSAKEIGRRLFIGERTVETHLSNAYAKLGVRTRVELLRLSQRRHNG